MIPVRLPWRLRARPSATLHEIQGQLRRADWYTNDTRLGRVRQELVNSAVLMQVQSGRNGLLSTESAVDSLQQFRLPQAGLPCTIAPHALCQSPRVGTDMCCRHSGEHSILRSMYVGGSEICAPTTRFLVVIGRSTFGFASEASQGR